MSLLPLLLTSGMAEKKMRSAMPHDARGSQPDQPSYLVSSVLKMTATDPKASAMMCRKMPCMFSLSWLWVWAGLIGDGGFGDSGETDGIENGVGGISGNGEVFVSACLAWPLHFE